ncbi:MAM and LDL-receptor class A domain-containing protein 2-like, partial [Anneissia japonica]|uniref:MAM and LDL-receptor class A domain-containing protein 2-like n=1 Tax=Anneissia japonica TaxID=1529436 RepID=UPI001425713E
MVFAVTSIMGGVAGITALVCLINGSVLLQESMALMKALVTLHQFYGRAYDPNEIVVADNIYITEGICLKNEGGSCCDFEYNWCGWTNYYSSSNLWTRSSGSIGIGQDGYYIYVQSSSGYRYGKLRSPKIQATWGEFCLTFYYYASDVNQYLRIYQDNTNSFRDVFFVRGDSSSQWEYVSLQLVNRYNYELMLRVDATNGKIAVDNICIIEGLCAENNVKDTEKPELRCPEDETVDTDDGKATASVDYSRKINANDNSGNTSTIIPYPNETFPVDIGTGAHVMFTFTVNDSSGNNATCTFTITVQYTEKPTINCTPDETIDTDEGSATAPVDYSNREKPTVNCPPDETIDTDEGSATVSVDYSSKINATDNSGDIPTISPKPNETFPVDIGIGPHKFSFTATDSSGNYDNCMFTIQG